MLRYINLTNEKGLNATVCYANFVESKKTEKIPGGLRILKSTVETSPDFLMQKYNLSNKRQLAELLILDDADIDFEKEGMKITGSRKVYSDALGKISHKVTAKEKIMNPDGSFREEKPAALRVGNMNMEVPIRWSGLYIPAAKAYRRYVFCKHYQIYHTNGLTYEFLYNIAKELGEKDSLMFVGAGSDGTEPLVMQNGGKKYRGFLEGKAREDGSYFLILNLSELELKAENKL